MQLFVRLLIAAFVLASVPVSADSWMPAMRTTYLSPNKTVRLTVIPRDLEDQLSYFSDKVDGKEPAIRLEALAPPEPVISKNDDRDGEEDEVMTDALNTAADRAAAETQKPDTPND